MADWFGYSVPPIDFGWEHMQTVEAVAQRLAVEAATIAVKGTSPDFDYESHINYQEFLRQWKSAQEQAQDLGWEGDHRHAPVVFWVPTDNGFECGFVIKQDNNGSSFVLSPVRMPQFADYEGK